MSRVVELQNRRQAAPPFQPAYRGSGLLLHVTSLPSAYGIGDLGPEAFAWIDRLHDAGQTWWQALPLGPTGYGNSPYQPLSSFAGNALIISPESLNADGLLDPKDYDVLFAPGAIDYASAIPFKERLLETAWNRFQQMRRGDLLREYEEFCWDQASWLEDYALFRALKARYGGAYYIEWPAELVRRHAGVLAEARRELSDEIDRIRFAQFLLSRQGEKLKQYAHSKGVTLIGDLPFFVSPDSSDVWANPGFFLLDDDCLPRFVAGVPPDYFSEQGQLWGNPVYNWEALRDTGYQWCIDRLRALLSHVDLIRLDHFRGFAAAWHIPSGAPTAQTGSWQPGPGAEFFRKVEAELGALPFIAEDLGLITPDVEALRDQFQIPGTRVLQFAFDGHEDNPHLPQNFVSNSVVYTGTHDNPTSREWFEELTTTQRDTVRSKYLKVWRGLSTFRSESSFRTWLTRVAMNQAMESHRRQGPSRSRRADVNLDAIAAARELQDESMIRAEVVRTVRSAVAGLSPKYRQVLTLCGLQDLSARETAQRLHSTIPQ